MDSFERMLVANTLLVAITTRCPLQCAHCYHNSDTRTDIDHNNLLNFLATINTNFPGRVLISDGEPFLFPDLITRISEILKSKGIELYINSSLYFTKQKNVDISIMKVIDCIDGLIVSIDEFHEKYVPRGNIIKFLKKYKASRKDLKITVQSVKYIGNEYYLDGLKKEIKRELGSDTSFWVAALQKRGKAKNLSIEFINTQSHKLHPCPLIGWPTISCSGDIYACCNHMVEGNKDTHLWLGHISATTWNETYSRLNKNKVLRLIRILDPRIFSNNTTGSKCNACLSLKKGTFENKVFSTFSSKL